MANAEAAILGYLVKRGIECVLDALAGTGCADAALFTLVILIFERFTADVAGAAVEVFGRLPGGGESYVEIAVELILHHFCPPSGVVAYGVFDGIEVSAGQGEVAGAVLVRSTAAAFMCDIAEIAGLSPCAEPDAGLMSGAEVWITPTKISHARISSRRSAVSSLKKR
jgi:hypothetical protein